MNSSLISHVYWDTLYKNENIIKFSYIFYLFTLDEHWNAKLDILLQWKPENYATERQHHSVFDVVTSQTKLISNLFNYLSSYMGLLESKLSLPMPDFSGYHATWI